MINWPEMLHHAEEVGLTVFWPELLLSRSSGSLGLRSSCSFMTFEVGSASQQPRGLLRGPRRSSAFRSPPGAKSERSEAKVDGAWTSV
jgi:hypothetical protein